jgi:RHS repeat-associated protein
MTTVGGETTPIAVGYQPTIGFAGYFQYAGASPSPLSFAANRVYQSTLGRWLSRDPMNPMGLGAAAPYSLDYSATDLNLYAYAGDDPNKRIDPSGLQVPPVMDALERVAPIVENELEPLAQEQGQALLAEINSALQNGVPEQFSSWTPAQAYAAGVEGQVASGVEQNFERIPSLTGTANYRVPDGLDWANGVLSEVKNRGYQALTGQIQDFIAFAQKAALQFNLYLPPNADVSAQLQEQIDNGNVSRLDLLICK